MFTVFKYTRKFLKRFRSDEKGATAIEYGLLVGLIAISLMIGIGAVYDAIDKMFSRVHTVVEDTQTTAS